MVVLGHSLRLDGHRFTRTSHKLQHHVYTVERTHLFPAPQFSFSSHFFPPSIPLSLTLPLICNVPTAGFQPQRLEDVVRGKLRVASSPVVLQYEEVGAHMLVSTFTIFSLSLFCPRWLSFGGCFQSDLYRRVQQFYLAMQGGTFVCQHLKERRGIAKKMNARIDLQRSAFTILIIHFYEDVRIFERSSSVPLPRDTRPLSSRWSYSRLLPSSKS